MFRSCSITSRSNIPVISQERPNYEYEVTIVDDDFFETKTVFANVATEAAAIALIDIYSQKNLNVAGNLALLMRYVEHNFPALDINLQIRAYQNNIPEYSKYHDQVMGYLVFL